MLNWMSNTKVTAAAPPHVEKPTITAQSRAEDKSTLVLQTPRTTVAEKLGAPDTLGTYDDTTLRKLLSAEAGEPFALTIFDLTQH